VISLAETVVVAVTSSGRWFRGDLQVRPRKPLRYEHGHVVGFTSMRCSDTPAAGCPRAHIHGRTMERSLEALTTMRVGDTLTTEILTGVLIISLVSSMSCSLPNTRQVNGNSQARRVQQVEGLFRARQRDLRLGDFRAFDNPLGREVAILDGMVKSRRTRSF